MHFGVANWLKQLRSFGFKTFDGIIDESYDSIEDNVERWKAAFAQVEYLSKQNLVDVLLQSKRIVDHNHRRLYEFKQEKFNEMWSMIQPHLR